MTVLINQVDQANPLRCARRGNELKIIAFIEPNQTEVIEQILRHCGLWDEPAARAPLATAIAVEG